MPNMILPQIDADVLKDTIPLNSAVGDINLHISFLRNKGQKPIQIFANLYEKRNYSKKSFRFLIENYREHLIYEKRKHLRTCITSIALTLLALIVLILCIKENFSDHHVAEFVGVMGFCAPIGALYSIVKYYSNVQFSNQVSEISYRDITKKYRKDRRAKSNRKKLPNKLNISNSGNTKVTNVTSHFGSLTGDLNSYIHYLRRQGKTPTQIFVELYQKRKYTENFFQSAIGQYQAYLLVKNEKYLGSLLIQVIIILVGIVLLLLAKSMHNSIDLIFDMIILLIVKGIAFGLINLTRCYRNKKWIKLVSTVSYSNLIRQVQKDSQTVTNNAIEEPPLDLLFCAIDDSDKLEAELFIFQERIGDDFFEEKINNEKWSREDVIVYLQENKISERGQAKILDELGEYVADKHRYRKGW